MQEAVQCSLIMLGNVLHDTAEITRLLATAVNIETALTDGAKHC
jgi:hypothetical protein